MVLILIGLLVDIEVAILKVNFQFRIKSVAEFVEIF